MLFEKTQRGCFRDPLASLSEAATGLLGAFAKGIATDRDPVEAAKTEPW